MTTQRRPRGSGGLSYDETRGQWRITWPIKNAPAGKEWVDGSRIDAERILRRRLAERDAGSPRLDHRLTLAGWCATWLETHVAAKAIGTRIRYADITARVILPAIGHVRMAELDDVEIAQFKARLIRQGRTPRGADSVLDVLSAALGQARRSKVIAHNPRTGVSRERVPRRVIDAPSRTEADALLAAVASQPLRRAAFALAIGHGLRSSEVRGLQRRDRSADGRRLAIVRKAEARTGSLEEEPKDGSTGVVILKPWAAAALDALGPGAPASLYFPGARDPGKPINDHTLLDWAYEASERAGLRKRFTFHDLRRAFGTRIATGNSQATITAEMRHRDYRTSLVYIAPVELVDDLEPPASWHEATR